MSLIILLEFITALLTSLFYKKYKKSTFTFFLVYVWILFGVEFVAMILKEMSILNYWLYNIYTFFEINLVFLIYISLIVGSTKKKVLTTLVVIFNIIYFLSFFIASFQKYTLPIGSLMIIVFLTFYLLELLNSNDIVNYKKNLFFWITIGFLLYYLGTTPFQTILNIGGFTNRNLFIIPTILTLITHSCFIYGLLCSKKETK